MFTFISKLQRKPEPVKRSIALLVSLAVTGLIVILWLVSLGSASDNAVSVAAPVEEEPGPFEAFAENIGSFFADTAETVRSTAGIFSGLSPKAETVENPASNMPDAE